MKICLTSKVKTKKMSFPYFANYFLQLVFIFNAQKIFFPKNVLSILDLAQVFPIAARKILVWS